MKKLISVLSVGVLVLLLASPAQADVWLFNVLNVEKKLGDSNFSLEFNVFNSLETTKSVNQFFIYGGISYEYLKGQKIAIQPGISMNYPVGEHQPMVSISTWGALTDKISYSLEMDVIGISKPTYFYSGSIRYEILPNLFAGSFVLGENLHPAIGPTLRYIFNTQFGSIGIEYLHQIGMTDGFSQTPTFQLLMFL